MPQTSYALDRTVAVAGQPVEVVRKSARYSASEEIPPGRLVELHTDGQLRLYRGGKKYGISMYRDAKEPGAWAIDDYVPCLRTGSIYVDFDGTAASAADLAGANFRGPDTTATARGKATQAATTSASDAQVFGGGSAKFIATPTADTGLALLEVDFPAEEADSTDDAADPILLSFTAGDTAPADIKNGQVYELDTTAANSTVSLPAAAKDGTVAFFIANGTKNGHTLTFRDVATAISAATTASKRVAAVAVKAGGKWAVTLTVGP